MTGPISRSTWCSAPQIRRCSHVRDVVPCGRCREARAARCRPQGGRRQGVTEGTLQGLSADGPADLRGGSWVADAMVIRRRLRTIGKGAGVRFLAKRPKVDGEADLSALDRGRGKHPTFGRSPWVVQAAGMRAGIVRRVEESKVTREAVEGFTQALDRIAESLAGGGGAPPPGGERGGGRGGGRGPPRRGFAKSRSTSGATPSRHGLCCG